MHEQEQVDTDDQTLWESLDTTSRVMLTLTMAIGALWVAATINFHTSGWWWPLLGALGTAVGVLVTFWVLLMGDYRKGTERLRFQSDSAAHRLPLGD